MSNPKLEFFRFKLNHKSGTKKNFLQFMLENGKCTLRQKDNAIFGALYKYFMEAPSKGFAKSESLKKVVTVISNRGKKKINKHYNERPKPDFSHYIISGVVNGGSFGKERILSDLDKKDESGNIRSTQPVLQYYYVFLYLPLNHYEGLLMVHSDSADETITQAMRNYVAGLFTLGDYRKPIMTAFVPKHFEKEYKDGAIISSMSFAKTDISPLIEDDEPAKDSVNEFDVKITLTLKGEKADLSKAAVIRKFFSKRFFGTKDVNYRLEEFDKCTISTKNEETNSTKTFDWNIRDQELRPVVYLNDRVIMEDDGTPNFVALNSYCHQIFEDIIKHDLRPDLDVKRVD